MQFQSRLSQWSKTPKKLRRSYGEIPIDEVPQDREGDFEPQIVPKRKKDISEIEQKIITMSAKGMTTRQISDIVEDIYSFEVSEGMVTAVTNKILSQIEEWRQRPLSAIYPIVFIDAIHFSVREEYIVKKIAAAYPNTEYQRCIVHQVRNTLKYVAEKEKKAFANDLKSTSTMRQTKKRAMSVCMQLGKNSRKSIRTL